MDNNNNQAKGYCSNVDVERGEERDFTIANNAAY